MWRHMQTHTKCVPDDNEYNKIPLDGNTCCHGHAYLMPTVEVVFFQKPGQLALSRRSLLDFRRWASGAGQWNEYRSNAAGQNRVALSGNVKSWLNNNPMMGQQCLQSYTNAEIQHHRSSIALWPELIPVPLYEPLPPNTLHSTPVMRSQSFWKLMDHNTDGPSLQNQLDLMQIAKPLLHKDAVISQKQGHSTQKRKLPYHYILQNIF